MPTLHAQCGFEVSYPIQKEDGNHVGDTLTQFINNFGAPERLTFDGASIQTGPKTRFMDAIRKYEIKYHVSGPRQPNEDPAETVIHEVKKALVLDHAKKRCQHNFVIMVLLGFSRPRTCAQICLSTPKVVRQ